MEGITVAVLTYNHGDYLKQALDGIFIQQVDVPLYVIVHDDASTDGTPRVLDYYTKLYPDQLTVITQTENQFSQNIAPFITHILPRVRTEFVALCEGDDYWIDEKKLQSQIDFLTGHKKFSLHCHAVKHTYDGVPEGEGYSYPGVPPFDFGFIEEFRSHFIPTCSAVIRTKSLQAHPLDGRVGRNDFKIFCLALSQGLGHFEKKEMAVKRKNKTSVSRSPLFATKIKRFTYEALLNIESFCPPEHCAEVRKSLMHAGIRLLKGWRRQPKTSLPNVFFHTVRCWALR